MYILVILRGETENEGSGGPKKKKPPSLLLTMSLKSFRAFFTTWNIGVFGGTEKKKKIGREEREELKIESSATCVIHSWCVEEKNKEKEEK